MFPSLVFDDEALPVTATGDVKIPDMDRRGICQAGTASGLSV